MTEGPKRRSIRQYSVVILAVFVAGVLVGLWIGRWENRVRQEAAGVLSEGRFIEVMGEDLDQINRYWDSKPEAARALLERLLRAHERLLQSVKRSGYNGVLTETNINKDMGFIHIRLAVLCRRLNEPDSVSEHAQKAMELMDISSNQVYDTIARLEATNTVHSMAPE
jgi:hypothetical protein